MKEKKNIVVSYSRNELKEEDRTFVQDKYNF